MKEQNLVKTIPHIQKSDVDALFDDKLLALRIPSFFSEDAADSAAKWLLKNFAAKRWNLGKDSEIPTDMSYLLGVPREMAHKSEKDASTYYAQVKTFEQNLREAFSSNSSPLDVFIQKLNQALETEVTIEPFNHQPGLPAIVRYMSPDSILDDDVSPEGVCHIDSVPENKMISMNMYLSVPESGGELNLWDLPLEERRSNKPLYRLLIHHAFTPGYRDKIQAFLPAPHVLKVSPGDLVLFDSSRPHSVRGFSQGHRITVQTFIRRRENKTFLFS